MKVPLSFYPLGYWEQKLKLKKKDLLEEKEEDLLLPSTSIELLVWCIWTFSSSCFKMPTGTGKLFTSYSGKFSLFHLLSSLIWLVWLFFYSPIFEWVTYGRMLRTSDACFEATECPFREALLSISQIEWKLSIDSNRLFVFIALSCNDRNFAWHSHYFFVCWLTSNRWSLKVSLRFSHMVSFKILCFQVGYV